jgi:hypothetical protein
VGTDIDQMEDLRLVVAERSRGIAHLTDVLPSAL